MAELKQLVCPSCGAKASITGDEVQVTCDYCGNPIIVPEELRNKKADDASPLVQALKDLQERPPVVVVQPPVQRVYVPGAATTVASGTGGGIIGCIITLVILSIVAGAIFFSLPASALGQLTSLVPGLPAIGFAKQTVEFGSEGTGPGFFQDARHVAVDGKGNVYVSDLNTLRIQRFDPTGKFLNFWTIEEKAQFNGKNGPTRLAADKDGNLYAVWDHFILKYEGATGKLQSKLTGAVTNQVLGWTEDINDIALLANGGLLAITNNNNSDDLVRFDASGKVVNRVKKVVSGPKDDSVFGSSLHLAVDGLNNVYILDGWVGKPTVYRYTLDGKFLNRFGSKGKEPGQFDAFNDLVAVDGKSRIFVKDWNNLFVFDADGRYLNTIDGSTYGNSLYDVAINNITNEIWVVGYQNKVHKLVINEAK